MDSLSSFDIVWPGQVRALATAFAAVLGAVVAAGLPKISHRGLCILISFSAGALLSVALFDLVPESVEMTGWGGTVASLIAGYTAFFLISRFVSHVCPACSATHAEAHFHAVTGPLVAALSVHSFMDGLALYGHSSSRVDFLVCLAVLLHKFPEGLALTLVARGSGMSRPKALGLAVFVEVATTMIGAWAGAGILMGLTPSAAALTLGVVAGSFVFLVFHALLSEVFKHHPRSTIAAALVGAALIGLAGHFWGG